MKRVLMLCMAVLMTVMLGGGAIADTLPEQGLTYPVNLTSADGTGTPVGTVKLTDSDYGLLIRPSLTSLPPGLHGFHIHANPNCEPAEKNGSSVPGLAAGGHYDPLETKEHLGPYGNGHLGDLPPLYVDPNGEAMALVLAPRLTVSDVIGHAVIVHEGGDNFSDEPAALGGGGARLACGVIGFQESGNL